MLALQRKPVLSSRYGVDDEGRRAKIKYRSKSFFGHDFCAFGSANIVNVKREPCLSALCESHFI